MSHLPLPGAAVSPLLAAGLLLAAIPTMRAFDLAHPTVSEILSATGASRSRAYELRFAILDALPDLQRPRGRPPDRTAEPEPDDKLAIATEVLRYVMEHPGSVARHDERRRYSDAFRARILDRLAARREVPLPDFADAAQIPESTLRDWLRGERVQTAPPATLATSRGPTSEQVQTVLHAWTSWSGSFTDFCDHVQTHWRVPFGRTLLASVLEAHGVRIPKRRPGRKPDADALRGQFETFFPGAQWVGDGTELGVAINGEDFTVNLELLVDAHTAAFTGASVRPTEDAAAVIEAFTDGVATTGKPPLAVLLDNKPSNHADVVRDALGDTCDIPATPFRPENKAHCEGAFGLFAQTAPVLEITACSPEQLALEVGRLVATTWARAVNHRPRADRGGRSRVQLYGDDPPTEEQIAQAKAALEERVRRQELARRTRAARQDPVVRQLLADAFARLELDDPRGNLLTAIAGYPLDAIVEGIAIFDGKQRAGTLPDGVDARYLLGIVRNVAQEAEGMAIADELWRARLDARDRVLTHLQDQRERIEEEPPDPEDLVRDYVDRALRPDRLLHRFFWLSAAADVINEEPEDALRRPLFRLAARRIHSTHALPHPARLRATRFLAAKVVALA